MIILEVQNRILQDTVLAQLNWTGEEKRDPIDVRVCDFDDVSYRLTIEADNRDVLLVSMASPSLGQNMEKGAADQIKEIYSDLVAPNPVAGYDLTLSIDMSKVKGKEEEIARRVSMLKPNVVGGVFHYFTKKLKADEVEQPYRFQLRGDTTVYVFPAKDRVVFIYSLHFDDKAENCIAKVFMQEFVDAKKKIGKAPPVSFSAAPPRELAHFGIVDANVNLGYVSFAVLKPHVTDEKLRQRVCEQLQTFRTYTQYHIKCSKSYFHSRMRAKTVELLKVLSRAKVEQGDENAREKVVRTVGGKVFKRAAP